MAAVAGEPRFVVVGTGRSGTAYTARLLTAAGITTGHEEWWSVSGWQRKGLVGDSSWFAAPHLRDFDGFVFNQVRDPLAVVNSLIKSPERGLADEARRRTLILRGDVVEQAVTIALGWRRLCDALPLAGRWRLEDIDAGVVNHIAQALGVTAYADAALAATARDTNWHGEAKFTYGWDDLPRNPETRELMRAAERDGYLAEDAE